MFGIKINLGNGRWKWAQRPAGGQALFHRYVDALDQLVLWWPTATWLTFTVEKVPA